MKHVNNIYKLIQDDVSKREPFNNDFLKLKANDNLLQYIDVIAGTLEKIDGITYLGSEIRPEKEVIESRKFKNIEESRLILINLKFRIRGVIDQNKEYKEEEYTLPLFFFKLINDNYFIYNGVKYVPIYQIVDKFYKLNNVLVLKTLMMGVFLRGNKTSIESMTGAIYNGREYKIHLFKKKIPTLLYYLAKFGMAKTLEFFDLTTDDIKILHSKNNAAEYNEALINQNIDVFELQKNTYLLVKKDSITDQLKTDVVISLHTLFSKMPKFRYSSLKSPDYYFKKFTNSFTTNPNNTKKGEKVLISFEKIFDEQTKFVLNIDDKDKEDVYHIVKWMMKNFNKLMKQDNMDLGNKRLRFYEYMLIPLIVKFNSSNNRLFNDKGTVTFSQLQTIFKRISPSFLLKSIISSNSSTISELIRYDNTSFNNIDLFSMLKASIKGPQSIASKGASGRTEIPLRYRNIHPSYLGRVSITYAPSNDPGLNFILTPFVEVDDRMYFKKLRPELQEEVDKLSSNVGEIINV